MTNGKRRDAQHELEGLIDLNQASINNDWCRTKEFIRDKPHRKQPLQVGNITVVFADHARLLCDEIAKWPVIIGCVAWLTHKDILAALQGREVCIIVQKEDWLRPDTDNWTMARQRIQYDLLHGLDDKYAFDAGYNQGSGEGWGPVRCCGMLKTQKQVPARMHHKFLVFGEYVEHTRPNPRPYDPNRPGDAEFWEPTEEWTEFEPRAVWTGSFNFTGNAATSLENAVLIRDPVIAKAYTDEWITVLGLSEELDWNAEWVATDVRIGT